MTNGKLDMEKKFFSLLKNNSNPQKVNQSVLVRMGASLYALTCMSVILGLYIYITLCGFSLDSTYIITTNNLREIFSRSTIITPVSSALIFLLMFFLPVFLKKFDCPVKRAFISAVLFFCIGIISLLFLPDPAKLKEYHGFTIILLVIFSILVGVVYGILSTPLVQSVLEKLRYKNPLLISVRHDLAKSEQDRWGKGLQFFMSITLGLMISGALAWVSYPVSESIQKSLYHDYILLRMEQIIIVEALIFIGFFIITYNIFQRLNETHNIFKDDYQVLHKLILKSKKIPKKP